MALFKATPQVMRSLGAGTQGPAEGGTRAVARTEPGNSFARASMK